MPYRNREISLRKGRERSAASYQRFRSILRDAKNKPCTDCRKSYPPIVMDLHHCRGVKKYNVAEMVHKPIEVLLDEIEKCDVLCANCHRMRHAREDGEIL